jgi:hypothetical protein
MFNAQKDQLFTLIKSLTKAEKRAFTLYINRLQSGRDSKFAQLFETLSKMDHYDEAAVLKKLTDVKKRQLSNIKRHLYRQILTSLRLIHIQKNIDIQIREQLDFARILYGKGMYMQALRLLDRNKKLAVEHHQDLLHLEILEFQKLIEARHITRSRLVKNKMEALLEEAAHRSRVAHSSNLFSNFNIQVHGWYIQRGHVHDEQGVEAIREYFKEQYPKDFREDQLTFFEKAHLYQAYMWYHYILLDFEAAMKYARQWVGLFEQNEKMKDKDPGLYMRSLYYLLVLLFMLRDRSGFQSYLDQFEVFVRIHGENLDDSARMICFTYLNLSRLNFLYITKDYQKGLSLIKEVEKELPRLEATMDLHRILLFYFKFAYLYFSCGAYEKALEYLNEIIHLKTGHLREDLLHNANLLHLLCHYELEHFSLLDYLLPAVERLLEKATEAGQIPVLTLELLQALVKAPPGQHLPIFRQYHRTLIKLASIPYEQKSLQYLDILSWVEGKVGINN